MKNIRKYIGTTIAAITLWSTTACTPSYIYDLPVNKAETGIIETETHSGDTGDLLPEGSTFEVHYIDVGQADSSFIECNGHTMLIDGGNVDDSSLIVSYLQQENIDYLDYVVCTHAYEDHVGGLSGALATIQVGTVYAPITGATTKAYSNFKNKVKEQGLEITHPTVGETIELGSSDVQFIGPITEDYEDINNTSIVLRVTYGDTSFFFTGDAERESEQDILNSEYNISADVLKVGHHGSASSTTYPFLREIMPRIAVIQVGQGNSYGHPNVNTISRLEDAGAAVYRTDLNGTVIIKSDGENLTVETEKK